MGLAQMVELQGETLEGSWGLGRLAGEVPKVDDGTWRWGRRRGHVRSQGGGRALGWE